MPKIIVQILLQYLNSRGKLVAQRAMCDSASTGEYRMITVELAGDYQQRHFASTTSELWQVVNHYTSQLKKLGFRWDRVERNRIEATRRNESVHIIWTDDRFA